jgi:hypothetical protein
MVLVFRKSGAWVFWLWMDRGTGDSAPISRTLDVTTQHSPCQSRTRTPSELEITAFQYATEYASTCRRVRTRAEIRLHAV